MSISVVNGYFCENSCDVAKAKKGEDPHPKVGTETDKAAGKDGTTASSRADGPAVVLGGALANMQGGSSVGDPPPVDPAQIASPAAAGKVLDILV